MDPVGAATSPVANASQVARRNIGEFGTQPVRDLIYKHIKNIHQKNIIRKK